MARGTFFLTTPDNTHSLTHIHTHKKNRTESHTNTNKHAPTFWTRNQDTMAS